MASSYEQFQERGDLDLSSYRDFQHGVLDEDSDATVVEAPIVWAIDAFPETETLHERTASALRALFPYSPVYPVYVLSEESFTDRGFSTFLKPALKPMATKAVRHLLEHFPANEFQPPRVLIENSASRATCARKLLRFSKKIGARAVAVGSRGHKSWSRLFVSSFSDSLLENADLPLLIAGPHTEPVYKGAKTIVFPTDFSLDCQKTYFEVLLLAQSLGAEVHVYHKNVEVTGQFAASGIGLFGGGWISVEPLIDLDWSDYAVDVRGWQSLADQMEVSTHFVRETFPEGTSDAIVHYVTELGSSTTLVAMVPHANQDSKPDRWPNVASAFLGSVTRDVIRACPCPVYICSKA